MERGFIEREIQLIPGIADAIFKKDMLFRAKMRCNKEQKQHCKVIFIVGDYFVGFLSFILLIVTLLSVF